MDVTDDKPKTCKSLAQVPDPKASFWERLKMLGGPRCGKPAAFETPFGYYCEGCIERYRESMRNPHSAINILTDRVPTEDEIAKSIRSLSS